MSEEDNESSKFYKIFSQIEKRLDEETNVYREFNLIKIPDLLFYLKNCSVASKNTLIPIKKIK